MDDAAVVRELQCLANWGNNRQRRSGLNRPALIDLAQGSAIDELHRQEIELTGLAEVVDCDDVRMVDLRESLRLARESFGKVWIRWMLRDQDLQRDQAPQRLLPCLVHCTHPAAPDQLDDLKLRKLGSQFFHFRRRPMRYGKVVCPRPECCLLE